MNHFDSNLQTWAMALFDELRQLSYDGTGISRMTYGPSESQAMATVAEHAVAEGLCVEYDAAANLIITLPGADASRPFAACEALSSIWVLSISPHRL